MYIKNNRGGVRNNWIDIAKALGIIFVLIAHAIPKENLLWISINQFHMPLFYLISGYLYRCKGSFKTFLYKKINALYVPYIICSLLMYFLFVLMKQESYGILSVIKIVIMYQSGPLLGATWFIPVLFYSIIGFDLLNRIIKNNTLIRTICIGMMVVGAVHTFPARISNCLVAIGFICLGTIVRRVDDIVKIPEWVSMPFFGIVLLVSTFSRVSVSTNTYTYPLLFIIIAIIGSYATILLSKLIDRMANGTLKKHLGWIGRNTIGIVIWQFVSFKIVILIQIMAYNLSISRIQDFPVIYEFVNPLWVLLYVIVGIYVSILLYNIGRIGIKKAIRFIIPDLLNSM